MNYYTISICNIYKILHIFRNLCKKKKKCFLFGGFFFSCYFFFHCIHFNFFFQEKIFENHFLIVFPLKFYIWNPLFIITTKERQLLHMWRKLPHAHNGKLNMNDNSFLKAKKKNQFAWYAIKVFCNNILDLKKNIMYQKLSQKYDPIIISLGFFSTKFPL